MKIGDTARSHIQRYERMKADRSVWDTHWDEVATYTNPRKNRRYGAFEGRGNRGRELFSAVVDSTAVNAAETLASALSGMMVSNSDPWLEYSTGDKELDQVDRVAEWMQRAASLQLELYARSNFYSEMYECLLDVCTLGTGTLYQHETLAPDEMGSVIRFLSSPIYDFCIETDLYKRLRTVARKFHFRFDQLLEEYGEDVCRLALGDSFEERAQRRGGDADTADLDVIHFVETEGNKNMPYRSLHIFEKTAMVLRVGGYEEMPYSIPRWSVTQGETYGRSPAMKLLPDIRMLQRVCESYVRGLQSVSNPAYQAPNKDFSTPLKLSPGSINYYNPRVQARIEPIMASQNPQINENFIVQIQERINRGFFVNHLQLREGPQMTATEVLQRTDEQWQVIGPALSRLFHEAVESQVHRTFGIMSRRGMFGPPPPEIRGSDLQVRFVSKIAKAQRMASTDGLRRLVQALEPLLVSDPSVLVKSLDARELLKIYANAIGFPAKGVYSDDEYRQAEEAEAQALQEMQQEEALAATEVNKNQAEAESKAAMAQGQGEQGGQQPG